MPLYYNTASTTTAGPVTFDGTAADILPAGGAAAAGSTGKAADAGHVHALSPLASEPAGTLATRFPGAVNSTGSLAALTTGGQVAVGAIGLPKGMTVSNIAVMIGGTPASGPTHFWVALTDSSLNVLAVSADNTNGALSARTFKQLSVTTDGSHPYTVAATGCYYIAVSASASTTAPTLMGVTFSGSATGLTPVVCGTAGTQAAPPAVAAQLASGTVTFANAMNFAAWIS
jgi:hypothetical protein